ncbi:MAG: benzoate 1,2-dioxygenase large subunit [Rhodospirillaceae bacterium]|nr:benzoate 1,2-dioxygenase large subunit [Rhodospirillaceae bacterium]|tara:strand:+ start:8766 stop:10097 length:1332 start_codon:yes stop_codon:yes gene_type:complete
MDGSYRASGFEGLVDDRVDEGVFRVDRSIYTDQEIFDAEIERIFERGWVYLCHESQIPDEGCYFSSDIGRHPVVVIRQKNDEIGAYINVCSHRGALLTPKKQGKARTLTCRFHGWAYSCDGRCVRIKNEKEGFGEEGFDRSQYDLKPVAKLANYRGFIFGCLVEDVEPIEEYLGAAAVWIDLMVEQSPEGLEVVPGSSTYVIRGNWKMQLENSVDGYHVSTVHRVFASTVRNREERDGLQGLKQTEGGRLVGIVPSGAYDLGNGHMSIWAQHTTPERRPIYKKREWLKENLPAAHVEWILEKGRNLALFPNVMLMDNPSTQIRYIKPISADRAEATVYCIAPVGEDAEARAARLRKFEDFYLTAGMATSDDMAALEDTMVGSMATQTKWSDFNRGMNKMIIGADEGAKAVGFEPVSSSESWENETLFFGFYRRWRDMMTAPDN